MPMTTFRPTTPEQTADAVRWALSNAEPLEILGAGSRRALGRPVQTAHALDLSGLSGILAYEPEELVLTALAGTPMAEINAALCEKRQRLAFEPPDYGPLHGLAAGGGTLGGLMAAGLSGPRRVKDGAARDHALGLQAVNGRAELYRAGGKVVKNVTGYDLPKLMTGSFGTLSVFTEITVKVLPAPEDAATLVLKGRDDMEGIAALTLAMRSPHEVSGAAHLPASVANRSGVADVAGAAATLIRVEGFGPSVAARVAALRAEIGADAVLDRDASHALWAEVRDAAYFAGDDDRAEAPRMVWKVSVPPKDGPRVAGRIRAGAEAGEAFYDWAGGLIWAATAPGHGSERVVRGAVGDNGHATLIRAPESLRAALPVFHPQPEAAAELTRRVKAGFDPGGLFNPGRMYAGV